MFEPTIGRYPINVVNMECLGVSQDMKLQTKKDIKVLVRPCFTRRKFITFFSVGNLQDKLFLETLPLFSGSQTRYFPSYPNHGIMLVLSMLQDNIEPESRSQEYDYAR